MDLSKLVADFIDSIPATMKTDTLLFVIIYGLGKDVALDDPETFPLVVKDALGAVNPFARIGALIRVIGSLDHILLRASINIRTAKTAIENAPRLGPDISERFMARYPMARSHADQTLSRWNKLRDTTITRYALVDFENEVLRSPH